MYKPLRANGNPRTGLLRFTQTLLLVVVAALAHASDYDLVILNGRVIDPETNFDAVRYGRLTAVHLRFHPMNQTPTESPIGFAEAFTNAVTLTSAVADCAQQRLRLAGD